MTGAEYWATRPLAACAMRINDNYIEETIPAYRTLEVSGRHDLSAEVDSYTTSADGAVYLGRRETSRTLRVRFAVKTDTTAELHEALGKVKAVLNDEEMRIIFADEPEVYYVGTRTEIMLDAFQPTTAMGTISIFCADPYKYSVMEYEEKADSSGVITISYGGSVPAAPRIIAKAAGEATGYIFTTDDGAQITAGKIFNSDGSGVAAPDVLDSIDFRDSGAAQAPNWGEATEAYDQSYSLAGEISYSQAIGAYPSNFGSGSGWHGPGVLLDVPTTGVRSFVLKLKLFMAPLLRSSSGRATVSCYYYDIANSTYKTMIRVTVAKRRQTDTARIYLAVSGTVVEQYDVDMRAHATGVDMDIAITKAQDYIGFDTPMNDRMSANKLANRTMSVRIPTLSAKEVAKIEIAFLRDGETRATAMGLQQSELIQYDSSLTASEFVNLLSEGDVVEVDTGTSEIMRNGFVTPRMGNIENDWEGFRLVPGLNAIQCETNAWADPAEYSAKYREVFL